MVPGRSGRVVTVKANAALLHAHGNTCAEEPSLWLHCYSCRPRNRTHLAGPAETAQLCSTIAGPNLEQLPEQQVQENGLGLSGGTTAGTGTPGGHP